MFGKFYIAGNRNTDEISRPRSHNLKFPSQCLWSPGPSPHCSATASHRGHWFDAGSFCLVFTEHLVSGRHRGGAKHVEISDENVMLFKIDCYRRSTANSDLLGETLRCFCKTYLWCPSQRVLMASRLCTSLKWEGVQKDLGGIRKKLQNFLFHLAL